MHVSEAFLGRSRSDGPGARARGADLGANQGRLGGRGRGRNSPCLAERRAGTAGS